jgi:integrase
MGSVYRRKVKVCTTCHRRLDTTAAHRACDAAGHLIEVREQGPWWIRYSVGGGLHCVSAESYKKADALKLLKAREAESSQAIATPTGVGTIGFEEAADGLLTDYRVNKKRSLRTVTLRIQKHLTPFFAGRAMAAITPPLIREYIAHRQASGASNATVNRDLITLKRMFSLAVQDGRLLTRPYIPLLKESNIRRGFFEREPFQILAAQLPPYMRGIAEFAYITGWRTPSEILPLEWRQVDLTAGEVRLDPGTTKNGEGRVFPFTRALRGVLERQQAVAEALTRDRGILTPYVFCYTIGRKAGRRVTDSGYLHAWRRARTAAGAHDRIPHDCRRTAVRNLVRAGVPERVAMQLTGHRTRAIFERYNITSPNDLREAAQRLDAFTADVAS